MILAMLKLGFRMDDIQSMNEEELKGYLYAYEEIINPAKQDGKIYKVKRGK